MTEYAVDESDGTELVSGRVGVGNAAGKCYCRSVAEFGK